MKIEIAADTRVSRDVQRAAIKIRARRSFSAEMPRFRSLDAALKIVATVYSV